MTTTDPEILAALRELHQDNGTGHCNHCYDWGGSSEEWPCETAWIMGAHIPGVSDWIPTL